MFSFFSAIFIVITLTSLSFIATGAMDVNPELNPVFLDPHQKEGPVFIEYGTADFYKQFLYKTFSNTRYWYVDGVWTNDSPYNLNVGEGIHGYTVFNNKPIDLYTGNYMYPLLKNQVLPFDKTYLGCLEFRGAELSDPSTYLKYFDKGTLDVYRIYANRLTMGADQSDTISAPFFEWYASWSELQDFKIFRHFYFPLDRDTPSWVNLFEISRTSFPNMSMLNDNEDWLKSSDISMFSTIEFFESKGRISLASADQSLWCDNYSVEQAMFRFYEPETGLIDFWEPKDLVLNHEIQRISTLLEKKPEEILAIFSNCFYTHNTVYFNFIGVESYDWICDPWYEISYVC